MIERLGEYTNVRVATVVGGLSMEKQAKAEALRQRPENCRGDSRRLDRPRSKHALVWFRGRGCGRFRRSRPVIRDGILEEIKEIMRNMPGAKANVVVQRDADGGKSWPVYPCVIRRERLSGFVGHNTDDLDRRNSENQTAIRGKERSAFVGFGIEIVQRQRNHRICENQSPSASIENSFRPFEH